ncbi:MAG: hypothetical protein LBH34_06390 [Prevotellaceae bacterium]|jgi:hypothetical protein|nr:hypothetical protein [Prevotellaceae bacterium]
MKRIPIICLALFFCASLTAQQVAEYKNSYIWGHSNRNTSSKGSALSAKTGDTYSLQNVVRKADSKDIDILCFYGKFGKNQPSFYLLAPLTPGLDVVWEKKGGTRPYSAFEGPKSDVDGPAHLKNWKTRNATKLKKVAAEDYDRADEASIAAIKFDETYMIPVQAGDVVAFETAETSSIAGKKGLIKIVGIEDDMDKPENAGNGQYQKLNLRIKVLK